MRFLRRVFWRILEWPIALLWFAYATFINATSRVNVEGNEPEGAAVYVNWHRYQSFLIGFHGRRKRWMLVSPAPPLEPVARFCKLMGLQLVRGTSGERGKEAVEELKAILRRGESVVLAVDGPAGPVFRAKRGCIELSRSTGLPIVPVAYRCSRGRELRSRWDHTLMPLPFGRVGVVYGASVMPGGTDEEMLASVEAI